MRLVQFVPDVLPQKHVKIVVLLGVIIKQHSPTMEK